MTLTETAQIIDKNKQLIGQEFEGRIIDELIAYPIDKYHYETFMKNYLDTFDGKVSIIPFKNDDMDIYCVLDKKHINRIPFNPFVRLEDVANILEVKY